MKLFRNTSGALREAQHLELLRDSGTLHVPTVYGVVVDSAILMEHINGIPLGHQSLTSIRDIDRITHEIVDNLAAYHSATGGSRAEGTQMGAEGHLKNRLRLVRDYAHEMMLRNQITAITLETLEHLTLIYPKMFDEAEKNTCLVHGDYNVWNILIDPTLNRVSAIIDPSGQQYGILEEDLFQLSYGVGESLELLSKYYATASRTVLEPFRLSVLKLMSEIIHLYKTGNNKLSAAIAKTTIDTRNHLEM